MFALNPMPEKSRSGRPPLLVLERHDAVNKFAHRVQLIQLIVRLVAESDTDHNVVRLRNVEITAEHLGVLHEVIRGDGA